MDALTKVSQYLGINQRFIIKVAEWAKVYWVHVRGKRPTLLSKKFVDRASKIRIGYTIAGDALAKDEVTNKTYILLSPGHYGSGAWSIAEINNPSPYSEFCQGIKVGNARYTEKPSTIRELMVLKAVANAWR